MSTLRSRSLAALAALALGAAGAIVVASPAAAVAPVVTSTADDGSGGVTLREAIQDVIDNGAGIDNTITFDLPVGPPWQITLLSSLPVINHPVTITGPGADALTILAPAGGGTIFDYRPSDATNHFALSGVTLSGGEVANTRGLFTDSGTQPVQSVSLSDVDLVDFRHAGPGAAAHIEDVTSTIDLTRITVDNSVASASHGGGIAISFSVNADVTITGSTFTGNGSNGNGGALHAQGLEVLDISDSNFSGNTTLASGGAIGAFGVGGHVTLTNVTAIGNSTGANGGGGAVFVESSRDLTIDGGLYQGNDATAGDGGALRVHDIAGLMSVEGGALFLDNHANHHGGAIAVVTCPSLDVQVIEGSTFDGNNTYGAGRDGGAIWLSNLRTFTAEDALFTGNDATRDGGAIAATAVFGTLLVQTSSFSENEAQGGSGGAIAVAGMRDEEQSTTVRWSSFTSNGATATNAMGGAFSMGATAAGTVLSIDASTFIDNSLESTDGVSAGAAIAAPSAEVGGHIDIVNSTIVERMPTDAFAVFVAGTTETGLVTVRNTTLLGIGGLLVELNQGAAQLINSILESTEYAGAELAFDGNLFTSQYSLYSSAFDASTFASQASNRFEVAGMGLKALADNGGPALPTGALLTRLPENDSPAVNTGNAAIEIDLPATDQRGPGFPRVIGSALDIGSIEIPVPPLPATGTEMPPWMPVLALTVLLLGAGALVFAAVSRRTDAA